MWKQMIITSKEPVPKWSPQIKCCCIAERKNVASDLGQILYYCGGDLINLREKGTPDIPEGMSKIVIRCGSPQGICGLVGVSETCSTLHQQGCILMVSQGRYPVFHASFVDFSTATD